MKDNVFKYQLNKLAKAQKELREKGVFKVNENNYKEYERFILNSYEDSIDMGDMSLKEICGLNKVLKKEAINVLIESILEDTEYDIVSHINTYIESKEGV